MQVQEIIDDIEILEGVKNNLHHLIILNDDVNTFDWVIISIVEICKYPLVQAEQLTMLVHYKGKAIVKTAEFEKLKHIKQAFIDRGISAIIE